MLRNGCRGFINDVCQVVYRHRPILERKNQAHSCRVGEHREDLDGEFNELAVGVYSANLLICIHVQIIA